MSGSQQQTPISPEQCTVHIEVHKPDEYPPVIRSFTLDVKHPTIRGAIGHIEGSLINRNLCRGEFLAVMDEESDELHRFSVKLFDTNGMLKSEIVDHEYHRGTGAWGRELDGGGLVYVEEVRVGPQYRNAGLGSWMLQKLLQSEHVGPTNWVFAWPVPTDTLDVNIPKRERREQTDKLIQFFRKNGFRRVGRTQFFGYAPQSTHPSRAIPVTEDAEGYFQPLIEEDDGGPADLSDPEVRKQRDEARLARFPLQYAIGASSAPENLPPGLLPPNFLQNFPPIRLTILNKFQENPDLIHVQDENGMTPLHVAATFGNVEAVETLLSTALTATSPPDLNRRDNTDGRTPLECLEADIRSKKEFADALLGGSSEGASDRQMKCVWLLKQAMGEDVGQLDSFIRQRKDGCTCGQCTEGWFSSHMRIRLRSVAAMTTDMMELERPSFARGRYTSDVPYLPGAYDLPMELQRRMTKRFYDALREVYFAIVGLCLPDNIPTKDALFQATRLIAMEYYSRGGKVEYALDFVLKTAEGESSLGDGTFDEYANEIEGWEQSPQCANDLNFKLVRLKLGLPGMAPQRSWDEMMGVDDDDESDD